MVSVLLTITKMSLETLAIAVSQILGSSLKQFACCPDNCVTLQIYLHIYVHIYEESQRT